MKIIYFILTSLFFMLSLSAQNKGYVQISFEVSGNCAMCKKKIENAVKIKGVKKANWDIKTKQLSLLHHPEMISLDQIQLRIAAAGYDTPKYRANDETYEALHECCHYPRK
ncbi:MAG: heavy-metal-associated domain-containing protein [Saprospiraceae bacterium]|nr:heavy-metal-associated domain-containing protein [Saprospiraceae bacterium]MBK7810387.1 heavy-metal-associated domain-containing protein [Saprospiraceae bacterium]MBK9629988.1 heavy-metal-associated domain-containing protein [Saprospiraceae bacterium]